MFLLFCFFRIIFSKMKCFSILRYLINIFTQTLKNICYRFPLLFIINPYDNLLHFPPFSITIEDTAANERKRVNVSEIFHLQVCVRAAPANLRHVESSAETREIHEENRSDQLAGAPWVRGGLCDVPSACWDFDWLEQAQVLCTLSQCLGVQKYRCTVLTTTSGS